ncbi:LLM class flavin-dependent oxidoreductase [Demequina zhanjiangensis]|uniref:LLM class flavin-dependent oxidoreductase n=1 Tax=Demequina zhanjiangensis TaxID=3051659 RepID=A0ABT8FXM0_9MICO|nr:LLM class flavin-dependent oxidoreductase [Demequina sp. SYSU T00b26]MDN4471635.1 LLM class flavin-dependent oxidoreductase [Demequina sp. SYSU T00b26]
MTVPLSLLDLAAIAPHGSARESLHHSVDLARAAEESGYQRVWYAEHHNMESIASSAPAVLVAHVAAHTSTIRLGAGGVMLPHHSPLTVAEQFGTLAELHPGRIDLGLGRAPGGDRAVYAALRSDPAAADRFPDDVAELRGLLAGDARDDGVRATPGAGTDVPLYVLGSSLFGAQLAAALGLPYAFASHFAPQALHQAVAVYRDLYRPSDAHPEPYVIAGFNVVAAEDGEEATTMFAAARRERVRRMAKRGPSTPEYSDSEIDAFLLTPQGEQLAQMMSRVAVGTPTQVREGIEAFAEEAQADEVITVHAALDADARVASVRLTGGAMAVAA